MPQQLLVYMTPWCPTCRDAQEALAEWKVAVCAINIARDREAAQRVRALTGFESVPTLVIAEDTGVEPFEPPAPLPPGSGPRGIDRGSVLTEPTRAQLRAWLIKHGLLPA